MVIHNKRIVHVINSKDVTFYRFLQPPSISCDTALSFGHGVCKSRQVGPFSPFLPCQCSCCSNKWTYVPPTLFSLPLSFRCSCFSVLPCSVAFIIIILPFTAMSSMIVISSVNDQYSCKSFCTSTLVSSLLFNMSSDTMAMFSSSSVAILTSYAIMQSGMSMNDYFINGNPHAWYFFVSL